MIVTYVPKTGVVTVVVVDSVVGKLWFHSFHFISFALLCFPKNSWLVSGMLVRTFGIRTPLKLIDNIQ